jgi:flagellin-like hook-associated protein FlgL
MRIDSNALTQWVVSGSQSSQLQLAQLEQDLSTGNDVTQASDNPLAYAQASSTQSNLSQLNAYSNAISTATTATAANNSAMTSIYNLVSQASENATSVASDTSSANMADFATEVSSLLTQVISAANQKDVNGNYMFGGTNNQAPLSSTGTFNASANGTVNSTLLAPGNSVQTTVVAGNPSGSPATDGFLYDSASGVNVIAALQQTITDLNSGNASAVQTTDVPALNKALDLISTYVGSTAASMSAVTTAKTQNASQVATEGNTLNSLTQTNVATASVQLQQIQNQYEATLEAGSRVLGLSILNYLGSTTTG